jgi:hypothetical protein
MFVFLMSFNPAESPSRVPQGCRSPALSSERPTRSAPVYFREMGVSNTLIWSRAQARGLRARRAGGLDAAARARGLGRPRGAEAAGGGRRHGGKTRGASRHREPLALPRREAGALCSDASACAAGVRARRGNALGDARGVRPHKALRPRSGSRHHRGAPPPPPCAGAAPTRLKQRKRSGVGDSACPISTGWGRGVSS